MIAKFRNIYLLVLKVPEGFGVPYLSITSYHYSQVKLIIDVTCHIFIG